jgi:hypothetical protein
MKAAPDAALATPAGALIARWRRPVQSVPHPRQDPAPGPAGTGLTHPAWCDPGHCAATSGGPHRGAPALVAGDRIGSALLRLRTWSPSDDPDGPVVLIELTTTDRDTGQHLRVDLSAPQLHRLHRLLAAIAGQISQP